MPRNIYTIGETVLDIVFKDFQPAAAKPGGAMLNTAVSLGRIGLPVHFISEYASDIVGDMIDGFLAANGVNTNNVYHYSEGKSALALAFLDENNNANYSFYKAYPSKRLDIPFPEVSQNDIIMFGSFYGITFEIRDFLKSFLKQAKENGAIIIYDPNFRKSHLSDLKALKPAIIENMSMADVVRTSDEDLSLIFNASTPDEAYEIVKPLCPNMVYTSSSKAVYLFTPFIQEMFPVRPIEPVSTIGAGDNFNAGLVYGLYRNNLGRTALVNLSLPQWQQLIGYGIDFATEVCLSYDNYIPMEFAQKMRHYRT